MPYRPLALVCVLAGGDYLLWNWSLQGSHDVLSLISGLTLPPLAIALAWLLALNATRVVARMARQPRGHPQRAPRRQQLAAQEAQETQQTSQREGDVAQGASASSKLAA